MGGGLAPPAPPFSLLWTKWTLHETRGLLYDYYEHKKVRNDLPTSVPVSLSSLEFVMGVSDGAVEKRTTVDEEATIKDERNPIDITGIHTIYLHYIPWHLHLLISDNKNPSTHSLQQFGRFVWHVLQLSGIQDGVGTVTPKMDIQVNTINR